MVLSCYHSPHISCAYMDNISVRAREVRYGSFVRWKCDELHILLRLK